GLPSVERPWPPSSSKGPFEMPHGDRIEPAPELSIARDEILPRLGQAHSASRTAPLDAPDNLDPGRALDLPQVSPRIPVGHAGNLRRRPQRTSFLDEFEQVGPAVSK